MEQEPPVRRRSPDERPPRNPLTSPLLAIALLLVAAALVAAILFVPGLLPQTAVGPTLTPSPSASCLPDQRGGCGPIGELPSPSPSALPSESALPTFLRPTPTPEPTFINVVVKAGDSLNTIAHAYKTTARSIAWWNRGTYPNLDPEAGPNYSPGHIEPGWILVLIPGVKVDDNNPPTPSPGPRTPAPSVSPSPAAS